MPAEGYVQRQTFCNTAAWESAALAPCYGLHLSRLFWLWLYSRKPGSTHSQGCFCVGFPDLWPHSVFCAQNPCGKLSKSCRTAVKSVTGDWFVNFFDICMKRWMDGALSFLLDSLPAKMCLDSVLCRLFHCTQPLIVKEASSFIRCRYLTSSQSREGRKTQRRGSSHFSQVMACTTAPPAIRTDPHINNVYSGAASTGAGNLCLSRSLCWQGNMCDCSLSVVAACPCLWISLSHGVCSHIDRDCATVRPAPGSPAAQLGRDQWSVFRTVKCLGELTEIRLITVLCARGRPCVFTCTFPSWISGHGSKSCIVKRKSCCVFTVKWCILVNAVFKPSGKHTSSSNINAVYVSWRPPPPSSQHTNKN